MSNYFKMSAMTIGSLGLLYMHLHDDSADNTDSVGSGSGSGSGSVWKKRIVLGLLFGLNAYGLWSLLFRKEPNKVSILKGRTRNPYLGEKNLW